MSDYPPEIQEAYYRSQYKEAQHKEAMKERLTLPITVKYAAATVISVFVLAWLAHFAGVTSFGQGVLLAYLYILVLSAWDTFFFDWVILANNKKL